MSNYVKAKELFILEGADIPESIMASVYVEGSFNRFYFHDNMPGNFLTIIVKPNLNYKNVVDVEVNWGLTGTTCFGYQSLSVAVNKLNETIKGSLGILIKEGFGK